MKFVFSARADLEDREAFDFLLKESLQSAQSFDRALQKTVDHLVRNPRSGIRLRQEGIRSFAMKDFRYRIFYRVDDDVLTILSIFHTSRDPNEVPVN